MERNKAKFDCQVRLIASLRDFSGPVPEGFFSQKEFFIVTLRRLAADLAEFKEQNLRALAADLLARLRRGPLPQAYITDFKDMLDKLVSGRDFMTASSVLAGSPAFIAERLSRLEPLSIAAEERKRPGEPRDPTADRLVSEAYRRLGFDSLEQLKEKGMPPDKVLETARARVAEYCTLYRLPLRAEDTLPPFSLSRIDAVTGACYRLLGRLKEDDRRGTI